MKSRADVMYILPYANHFALCPSGKRIFSHLKGIWGNPNDHHPHQMPDGCHHDPHIERKLVGAALLEKIPLAEHAGTLEVLNDGA
jgi:hypothetical protein